MQAIAFDTHRYVKRLTESGFTLKQAEILADEQVSLLNANLATKADMKQIEASLKADMKQIEASLKADMKQIEASLKADMKQIEASLKADIETVRSDLLKWMCGALIAQGGLVVALVKFVVTPGIAP